ncbi:hypothetical protein A2335_03760 [Candidatus Peregrinibacteria bacterium RIFOXYB2_FULL_32_7]|nr:MAG: hypothetical protein A2335_03760 [Candidatus Peregrinibacteria bacterium RIFOXYB2_FULL_32_7]
MKKLGVKLLLIVGLLGALWIHAPFVSANALTDTLTEIGDQTGLTNYEGDIHSEAVDKRGIRNITSGVLYLLDFAKYILGVIALIMLVLTGVRLSSTHDASSALDEAKKYFGALLLGFALVFIADVAVTQVFFGEYGEVLSSQESAQKAALRGAEEIRGIYTFIEMFLGAIAVLAIVISGISMMISTEDSSSQKKHIGYAALGLIIVGLSEAFIKDFIFDNYGEGINIETGQSLFVSITNFAISFIAIISVAAFVYGGYVYLSSFVSGDQSEKGKKAIIGAIIGILISAGAFAVTRTLLDFEDPEDTVGSVIELMNG